VFASKSLVEHLARGLVGIGGFAVTAVLATSHPWLALAALPVAFWALRGCPMCWTVGLAQTLLATARGKSAAGLCGDGSCASRKCAESD
jgi:hypothetical protein